MLIEIKSAGALAELTKEQTKSVLLFGADWHEACPMLKMVLGALAATEDNSGILFGHVDAESVSDLSDKFEVTMVPTILLLVGSDTVRERLEGEVLSDPSHVTLAVQRLAKVDDTASKIGSSGTGTPADTTNSSSNNASGETTKEDNGNGNDDGNDDPKQAALNDRLERLIRADTIMLFMKGTPDKPRCGFSRQAIDVLRKEQIPFGSFDILSDNDVRQGLKVYSDWPTYPQIYVRGELMGGLDILKETASEGSLEVDWGIADLLETANGASEESLDDRLEKLVNRHTIMLFMKGLPSNPQCGFSRQIVEILDATGVPYDAFNIFEDDEVRQGLKEFSDWPTYPQLYLKGELLGGLDIVREMKETGELEEMLQGQ